MGSTTFSTILSCDQQVICAKVQYSVLPKLDQLCLHNLLYESFMSSQEEGCNIGHALCEVIGVKHNTETTNHLEKQGPAVVMQNTHECLFNI